MTPATSVGVIDEELRVEASPLWPLALEGRPSTRGLRRETIYFFAADLLLVCFCFGVAILSRFATSSDLGRFFKSSILAGHLGFVILYVVLLGLFGHVYQVYAGNKLPSARKEQIGLIKASIMTTCTTAAFVYLSAVRGISFAVIAETAVLSTVGMVGWRLVRWNRISGGSNSRNVLIINPGPAGRGLDEYLSTNRHLGLVVKGYLDRRGKELTSSYPERRRLRNDAKILGGIQDLAYVVRHYFIDELFITAPENRGLVKYLLCEARRSGVDARVVPDLYDSLASTVPIDYLGPVPVLSFCHQSVPKLGFLVKRCVDLVMATAVICALLPFLLLTAILVKVNSAGPIFYRSIRIGKKGRKFVCYKFRTMVANADELRASLHHLNERQDILFKIADDPRITPLGRFLRKYSVDELPQLLNVLKGDMSLVGPRPPIPGEYLKYSADHLRRLDVLPGITGLWQVAARQDPSFESYITLDTQYVNTWSIWLDCKILFKTIAVVFAGTGQ